MLPIGQPVARKPETASCKLLLLLARSRCCGRYAPLHPTTYCAWPLQLGFDYVFDTLAGADMTIMEARQIKHLHAAPFKKPPIAPRSCHFPCASP